MGIFLKDSSSTPDCIFAGQRLSEFVLDCWDRWALGPKPADLSLIRRSSTWLGEEGKVVYLFFRKGEDRPAVVAKSVLACQYGAAIHKEAANTRAVWEKSILRPNVPRPLAVEIINGLPVYFEEACPGEGFPEKVRDCWRMKSKERLIRETVDAVVRWIESFQNAFNSKPRRLSASEVEKHWLAPLRTFAERHGLLSKTEKAFLGACTEAAESLKDRRIALPPVHGDLWGGSVLRGLDGGIRIIDWEFFQPRGLPVQDLIYFAIHPGFALRGKEDDGLLAEFKNLFYENVLVSTIRGRLQKQAAGAGLNGADTIKMVIGVLLAKLSLERDDEQPGPGSGTAWADLWRYFAQQHRKCRLII